MAKKKKKKELIRALAQRMASDEQTAARWLESMTEIMYEEFSEGNGVTLTNFGSFYVKPTSSTWVFKFNPSQKLRMLLGWSSTYKG